LKAYAQKQNKPPAQSWTNLTRPSPVRLQAKLKVNTPGDVYEQEADRVAAQITNLPERQIRRPCPCGGGCPECRAQHATEERLQTRSVRVNDAGAIEAPPIVNEALRSSGQPLDSSTRAFMESRFGHDFSQVRVHTDALAADSARAVSALAFTVGADVLFGTGRYAPQTTDGKKLLAHELVHVAQQTSSTFAGDHTSGIIQRSEEYCDQEHIECYRRCMKRKPPWPFDQGGPSAHNGFCRTKCLTEYMICIGEKAAEKAFDSMAAALDWLAKNPEVIVGTIVVVAGVAFVVATGGTGALVLVAL